MRFSGIDLPIRCKNKNVPAYYICVGFQVSDYDYYLRLQGFKIKIFLQKIQTRETYYHIKEHFAALQSYGLKLYYKI